MASEGRADLADKEQAAVSAVRLVRYVGTWIALTAFTLLTYALSFLPLGPFHVVVGLSIGFVKAMLVVLFFMHLWEEAGATRLSFGVSVFYLLLLLAFTLGDLVTRFLPSRPDWQARDATRTSGTELPEGPSPR